MSPQGEATLVKDDAVRFRDRLRKSLGYAPRFFMVGEYGDKSERPHYHGAFFGINRADFPELLQDTWGEGFTSSYPLDATRAAYIAGYCTKKMTSKDDTRLGSRHPEFSQMSRRPALADGIVQEIGKFLTTRQGRKYIEVTGDVPSVYRVQGKLWPLTDRHRRKLRVIAGLPELKRELVATNPMHPGYQLPEPPSLEELIHRSQLEVARGKKAQIFKQKTQRI